MLHHSVCVGTYPKGDAAVDDPFMLIKEASMKVESSPRIKHKSNMAGSEVKHKGRLRPNAAEANGMEQLMTFSSASKPVSRCEGNLNEDLSRLAPKAAVISPHHGPARSAAAASPRSPRRSKGKKTPGQKSPQSPKARKKANLQLPTTSRSPPQHRQSEMSTTRNPIALSNRREMTRTKLNLLKTEKLQLLDETSRQFQQQVVHDYQED